MLTKLTQLSGLPVVLEINAFGQEEYLDWTNITVEGEPTKTIETFVEGANGTGHYYVKESYELIEAYLDRTRGIVVPVDNGHYLRLGSLPG